MTVMNALNLFVFAIGLVIAVVVVVVITRPVALAAATARRSEMVGLPLDPEVTAAITRRLRLTRLVVGGVVIAGAAVAVCLALGPVGDDPRLILSVLPFVLVVGAAAATVIAVVRPLFTPAPGSPRVARAAPRRLADYLGPVRRALPVVVVAAAGFVIVFVVRGDADLAGVVVGIAAVVVLAALPLIDRAVVTAPQAAGDPLHLAWDEAFRADALAAARITVCLVALSAGALVPPSQPSWTGVALNLAMTAVVCVYARDGWRAAFGYPWFLAGLGSRR